jgi:predicted dehydrogenase
VLKVALVGCGKIADAHAAQLRRIPGCSLVAACDQEELMARQLSERFGLAAHFTNLTDLLQKVQPDVVHITTPPQSHFALAKQCLQAGAHVYVEKPFTLNTPDAEALIALAQEKRRLITAGHNDQFHCAARRMRELVREGYLGGPPVHMESYYGYELGHNSNYARALLADKEHWVRKLPGQLLHNIISHGIARIAEYLPGETAHVVAYGFSSPLLRSLGEEELVDELRVIISGAEGTTGYFTFSSQMRPVLHQFRVYGPCNGLILDQDNETLVQLPGRRYKSYAEHFLSPLVMAKQYVQNTVRSVRTFCANDLHPKGSLRFFVQSFYRAINEGTPMPLTYREILLTSRIMDSIFEQIRSRNSAKRSSPGHEQGVAAPEAHPSLAS